MSSENDEIKRQFETVMTKLEPADRVKVESYILKQREEAVKNARADTFTDRQGNLPNDGGFTMGKF